MDGWDGPEGDDVVEHGGGKAPRWLEALERLQRPGWMARRGWRPSRGAAVVGAAGLVLGLVAGYAAGYREIAAGARAPQGSAAPASGAAQAAASGSSTVAGSTPVSASPRACGSDPASPSPIVFPALPTGQDGQALIRFCAAAYGRSAPAASLAVSQTTGACSVQFGHQLQLGVEVSNQTGSDVTLRQVEASFPVSGGLREVSWAWGPCGSISSRGGQLAADMAGGEDLSPGENGWFTMTFQVLAKCPEPYPVQFIVRLDSAGRTSLAQVPGFNDLTQVPYSGCAGK